MRAEGTALLFAVVALVAWQRAEVRRPVAGPLPSAQGGDEARLAAADAADGTKDHVVSKCATCRLGMDGIPQHSVSYGGYELHFCSAECKETFRHDPGAVIRKLPPPVS